MTMTSPGGMNTVEYLCGVFAASPQLMLTVAPTFLNSWDSWSWFSFFLDDFEKSLIESLKSDPLPLTAGTKCHTSIISTGTSDRSATSPMELVPVLLRK